MTERLLQYIWQFQYLNSRELRTTEGEQLRIIHPGMYNTNQGPDFSNAKISLGKTVWAGNIELHINSSDWKNHKHSEDRHYNNVILHVVWQEDVKLELPFATLVLQDKVPKLLLHTFNELMNTPSPVPCATHVPRVDSILWTSWKERLLVERMEQRAAMILNYLQQTGFHWEEVLWWLLARNFGMPVNSQAFEWMARSIPFRVLSKHKDQIHQLESMFFGQSHLLEGSFTEDYPKLLQKEYRFLQKKYGLEKINVPPVFLRMRPSCFPSIRLAQLAMLLHENGRLFSKIREAAGIKELKETLVVTANDYWHYHYVFDEPSAYKEKKLGRQMTESLLINTVIPLLFAYGHLQHESQLKDKALKWLEEIGPEKNNITRGFEGLKLVNETALDSQAFLQLNNEYCRKKRCLECAIGNKLLKP